VKPTCRDSWTDAFDPGADISQVEISQRSKRLTCPSPIRYVVVGSGAAMPFDQLKQRQFIMLLGGAARPIGV
jgi:hypothetical protein